MNHSYKRIVVVLPFNIQNDSVLMQLRDDNPNIDAQGLWGFFGGLINLNETSIEAATRELEEEICYKAKNIYNLNSGFITDLKGIFAYAFTTKLIKPIDSLTLNEGRDFKFVTLEEIANGKIYSEKFKCFFPTVKTDYIKHCFTQSLDFWRNNNE